MKLFVPREGYVEDHHERLCRSAVVTLLSLLGHDSVDWPDMERDADRAARLVNADACFFTLRNPSCCPKWRLADVRLDVLKIQLVADFHYSRNLDDFAGADLLLLRYPTAIARARTMPGVDKIRAFDWLPHAVDPRLIPVNDGQRVAKIASIGIRNNYYPARTRAGAQLAAAGLLAEHNTDIKPVLPLADYYRELSAHEGGLACGSVFRFPVAKHVEIPAAGCLLFTDAPPGIERYLPDHLYVKYGRDDVVEKARSLLGTLEGKAMAQAAREHVASKHSIEARARELAQMSDAL